MVGVIKNSFTVSTLTTRRLSRCKVIKHRAIFKFIMYIIFSFCCFSAAPVDFTSKSRNKLTDLSDLLFHNPRSFKSSSFLLRYNRKRLKTAIRFRIVQNISSSSFKEGFRWARVFEPLVR